MAQSATAPSTSRLPQEENRDRFEEFKTNPIKSVATDPVSTFSIDVDTASYSFVRRSLKEGFLPQADTVRVEEMINYFPYDWKGPDSADDAVQLDRDGHADAVEHQHQADACRHQGLRRHADREAEGQPRLPDRRFRLDGRARTSCRCCKSAFRLLVDKLGPDDTVSIVTYAGNAGTVLMPTKASEKSKILSAIDNLTPGGTTAGEAGIRDAYKLAEQSFVEGRRQPRHAGDRRRLQCRPDRRRRPEAPDRGEAPVAACSCRCSASAAATSTTR